MWKSSDFAKGLKSIVVNEKKIEDLWSQESKNIEKQDLEICYLHYIKLCQKTSLTINDKFTIGEESFLWLVVDYKLRTTKINKK